MKIIKIIGGLGNQMFQYAFATALQQRCPEEKILFDLSYMDAYKLHQGLELERLCDISLPKATFLQRGTTTIPLKWHKLSRARQKLLRFSRECFDRRDNQYRKDWTSKNFHYYEGYWQNAMYFDKYRNIILKLFSFKPNYFNINTTNILKQIDGQENAVSIHVRRGDFLKSRVYTGCCTSDYYEKAIEYIKKNVESPVFYVCSNDIPWCKQNLPNIIGEAHITFVDWNKGEDSYQDMVIMSHCKHNIIANSSFSWWAAYLNKNSHAIICAPMKWNNLYKPLTIQLQHWNLF